MELAVKATPKAGRARVDGVVVGAAGAAWLAVRLTEAAEAGKASTALCALPAKSLGVAPSAVELVTGARVRWKRLRVAGDPTALAARLEALAGTDRPAPR